MSNTEKLVRWLQKNRHVSWIRHPSAEGSDQRALAARYLPHGAGAVFSFGFGGTDAQMRAFIEALRVFSYHTNIGDARSLIVNAANTVNGELSPEEKEQAEIPPETLRISVGLEDADDLIADLAQAFQTVFAD